MKPDYKKVKVSMPHCPKCGEQLSGNNSMARPWNCKCGVWQVIYPYTGEYEVKPKILEE